MALGTTAALLLGAGAFSSATQIGAGNAQAKNIERQAKYNSEIYGQQAEMIKEQRKIQDAQFIRDSARIRGSIVSRTAGKGLLLSGSPLAILIDNETQMQFDKAVTDYNTDIEYNYAKSGQTFTTQTGRNQARLSRFSGYGNAFSTMLTTGIALKGLK
jgi:hypothetical protein